MATAETSIQEPDYVNSPPTLQVRDLVVSFKVENDFPRAVDGISFDLYPNEVLGIVGESGSGKSVTSLAIMRLIPDPPGKIAEGSIKLRGQELLDISYEEMRDVRGNEIAMIFQEPMTALNPVFTVGMQVMETIRTHENVSKDEARKRAIEMLTRVGIPDAAKRLKEYPHQFSGGMRQRAMIAMALVCHPKILIADEPTTALDVTTQAQILDLMLELKQKEEGASIILITHDLAVVAETCHRVVVMYGGKVQEVATVEKLFARPLHPYTKGLLASLPSTHEKKDRLYTIPGNVPSILQMPEGCRFCTRCSEVIDRCHTEEPKLHDIGNGRKVRCHLLEEGING